jgi:putative sigma-54 modulation protein
LILKGRNLDVSQAVRKYVEKKMVRLSRHLDNILEVKVELTLEKTKSQADRYGVQVTMSTNHTILRAEERGEELLATIDAAMDVMDRRISRYKGKLYARGKSGSGKAEMPLEAAAPSPEREVRGRVVKLKRFPIKPMYPEEAAEQMELLGHDFFAFINAANDQVCVIYHRRDGDYGLLEPELG